MDAGTPRTALLCLGQAAVVSCAPDGTTTPLLGLSKPLALLAYLALSPNRTASRERLSDLLWGDQDRTAARHSLRRALSLIRSRVGPWVVDGDETECRVSPDLQFDISKFRGLVERGEYECALETYGGDFLAEFASPGCGEFENWASVERAHLRSLALRAAEALCRQSLDRGLHAKARSAAARMRQIDPNSELAWRLGLEVLVAAGDKLGAIAEAERFTAWLEREEREPEPSSRTLIRLASRSTPSHGAPAEPTRALVAEMVGREREFAAVLEEWQQAKSGTVRIAVVTGAAGLGKTRLMDSLTNRIRSRRERVVSLRAYPGERGIANAFVGALVYEVAQLPGAAGVASGVLRQLASLDPRLATEFNVEADRGLGDLAMRAAAVRELLAAVAEDAPLALLLDDMHWCDDASVGVLSGALARLTSVPLLLVCATRLPSCGLNTDERTQIISLAPFTEQEVEALVSSIAALPADEEWSRFLITRVTAATRGIPLLVLGALQQLVDEGTLQLRDGAWSVTDVRQCRERLRNIDALSTRLRALSPTALRLLLQCGLAGVPLPREVVSTLAGGGDAASAAHDELERAGYLRTSGSTVSVAHDAIAEAAIALVDANARRTASRELGSALVARAEAPWDEHGLRHLADAEALDAMGAPLASVTRRRLSALRGTPKSVAAAVLSRPASDPLIGRVVRDLPWTLRLRPAMRVAAIGGAFVLSTSGIVAAARYAERQEPEASIEIVEQTSPGTSRRMRVALDMGGWNSVSPLDGRFGAARADSLEPREPGSYFVPERDAWASEILSPDSGGVDVAQVDRNGTRTRLTYSRSDENPGAWSPDGRQLAIRTSAFSSSGYKTAGVLNLMTGVVRPVAGADLVVGVLAWSPDGTRLAITAGEPDSTLHYVCVAAVASNARTCHRAPRGDAKFVSWLSDTRVIVGGETPGSAYEMDVESGEFFAVDVMGARIRDVSPDSRWIAFDRVTGTVRDLLVAPTENPGAVRRLASNGPISPNAEITWHGRFSRREYLDTVSIGSAAESLLVGVPFQLAAVGKSNLGRSIPVRAAEWKIIGSAPAKIDSAGVLVPVRTGQVTVRLSAGGWRMTTRTFAIVDSKAEHVATETWTPEFADRWIRFGHPFPRVVEDERLGRAFFNNGDGYFFSGVYRARVEDARGGLALDAVVSLPITRLKEQYLVLGFAGARGWPERRRTWNHVSGYPEVFSAPSCSMAYPAGEGATGLLHVAGGGPLARRDGSGVPLLARGAPTHVRVQILPDGRCGVYVDGEKPWVSPQPMAPIDSMTVLIEGNSVGTRILVGPLTLTRGVPAGVDWSRRAPSP